MWRAKTDDEILAAARTLADYTEEGERFIRAELRRRGLPEPEPPVGKCPHCGRAISADYRGYCGECGESVTPEPRPAAEWVVATTSTWLHDALFLKSVLESAGIEAMIPNEHAIGELLYSNLVGGSGASQPLRALHRPTHSELVVANRVRCVSSVQMIRHGRRRGE